MSTREFRLVKGDRMVVLVPVTRLRWKVVRGTPKTGLRPGDEVTPGRLLEWRKASERVNGFRTRLSPGNLVLVNPVDDPQEEKEVLRLLRWRPWDPDFPPPTPAA